MTSTPKPWTRAQARAADSRGRPAALSRRASGVLMAIGLLAMGAGPVAAERPLNIQSDRYVVNQTFDQQSFPKDNNVWVYTARFAELFGMAPEGVDPALQGIEAAAFRVEEKSYKSCGMGGKAENCMDEYRCFTDVYVDESRHPLPWANDHQQADWLSDYNSIRWLRTPTERGGRPKAPTGVIPNPAVDRMFTLHPFADPETRREVNWFQNGNAPGLGDLSYNVVQVYGYKRNAIAGLTMITLHDGCMTYNTEKKRVTFRLESREEIASPTLKRFHEFQLPVAKSNAIRELRFSRAREYFKELMKIK
jgi:hypothetical protein